MRQGFDWGRWLLALAALAGFILALLAYFGSHNGIDHTEGALLVVVSTALLLIAAVVLEQFRPIRWLVEVLIFLDILGTAFACYMLDAYLLAALMVVALVGWIAHLARPGVPRPVTSSQPGAVA